MKPHSHHSQSWKEDFAKKLNKFLERTEEHILKEANPGGHYTEIWPRDASYILKDQFLSGNDIHAILQQILIIWSHQITGHGKEKIVYGRGSPEMNFKSVVANNEIKRRFEGALPTTIYHKEGFSEVYAQNPDIDSTALMISTTSWILSTFLKARLLSEPTTISVTDLSPSSTAGTLLSSSIDNKYKYEEETTISTISISKVINFIVPRMLKAIDYLKSRDIDDDGLLEQDHNEDWMDTILRKGKVVYSQACWILALKNLSSLLLELGNNNNKKVKAERIAKLTDRAINAVEKELWSKEDGCYIDIQQEEEHIGGPYRTLTQDVCLYLIAIIEGNENGNNSNNLFSNDILHNRQSKIHKRAISTLATIKRRIWKDKWPLVTEVELKKTGPWKLRPNQYHNHTFWPWSTGIEMLSRSKFDQYKECNTLFSKLASEDHPHIHTFYEWINPITDKAEGAYPFRTGISAVRIAIFDILNNMRRRRRRRRSLTL